MYQILYKFWKENKTENEFESNKKKAKQYRFVNYYKIRIDILNKSNEFEVSTNVEKKKS